MKKKMIMWGLTGFLCLTAIPVLSQLDSDTRRPDEIITAFGDKTAASSQVSALALGPGIDNLSLGDEYAPFQWGLKNYGEFQLTELTSKFNLMDYMIGGSDSETVGIPDGPGKYESKVTNAVPDIDINIKPAWDLYDNSENKRQVTVAIIDTGVDYNHQDLQNALWANPREVDGDGIDNDGNGLVDDIHGWNFYSGSNQLFAGEEDSHGTHAAGTIAAARKSYGIAGITDNSFVKIMPLKALGGSNGTGSVETVIQAIQYAEANGASICNLSLGTTVYDERLAKTIENSKMLFVIASGNGDYFGTGYNTDQKPVYPASLPFDNIISVSNLLFDGNLDSSSNYGAESVDIAAPGTYILSTVPGNEYAFMSGTSMAAPMVTGVAAMLYSFKPDLSLADVRAAIINSARKLDSLNGKVASGGILDAHRALTYQ